MKKSRIFLVFGVLSILAVLAFGMNFTTARSTNTDECSGCHIGIDTITISSNATGTVSTTLGDSFTLVVNADSGADLLRIEKTWEDNNFFDYSVQLVADDELGDTNPTEGEITATIVVTPLNGGSYNLRIWVAGAGDPLLSRSLDVAVDVAGSTTGFTTTTPIDPSAALVEMWYTLMYTLVPGMGLLMLVLGYYMIRRSA